MLIKSSFRMRSWTRRSSPFLWKKWMSWVDSCDWKRESCAIRMACAKICKSVCSGRWRSSVVNFRIAGPLNAGSCGIVFVFVFVQIQEIFWIEILIKNQGLIIKKTKKKWMAFQLQRNGLLHTLATIMIGSVCIIISLAPAICHGWAWKKILQC